MQSQQAKAPAYLTDAQAIEYRLTHSYDGYALGGAKYPNNREGRRALAHSWRGHRNDRIATKAVSA